MLLLFSLVQNCEISIWRRTSRTFIRIHYFQRESAFGSTGWFESHRPSFCLLSKLHVQQKIRKSATSQVTQPKQELYPITASFEGGKRQRWRTSGRWSPYLGLWNGVWMVIPANVADCAVWSSLKSRKLT